MCNGVFCRWSFCSESKGISRDLAHKIEIVENVIFLFLSRACTRFYYAFVSALKAPTALVVYIIMH